MNHSPQKCKICGEYHCLAGCVPVAECEAKGEVVAEIWQRKHKKLPAAAPALYEALKALLTLHDEDCRMLDRGIGTDTPRGQKVSRAREALKEVSNG